MKKFIALMLLALFLALPGLAESLLVNGIQAAPDTVYLDLGNAQIENFTQLAQELQALPMLEKVDLFAGRPNERQVWGLVEALPGVRLGLTMQVAGFRCRTDDIIFSMHRRGEPLYKSSAFEQLTLCPDMLALDLGHNIITDISFLKQNPKLKYLILADNRIMDLSPLSELKDLQYLEIFMNQVTDLSPLAGLTELVDLNLAYNQVTDLSPLYGLHKLERIWLSRNGLSKEQIAELQAALPQAHIHSTGYMSTGYGWREHPRFFAMRKTFDQGVFIPFDSPSEP